MPAIDGILETCLYVADLGRSAAFYRDVLGFASLFDSHRLVALDAGRRGVLLLFPRGGAVNEVRDRGGVIPGHDGAGRLHLAFAIPAADLAAWRTRLAERNVPITGEYHWRRGGTSLYFDDPDGHVVELATPGLWTTY
jgi:catechol-2,3-dioxygenase